MKAFDPFATQQQRDTLSAAVQDAMTVKFANLPLKEQTLLMRLVKQDTDLSTDHQTIDYSVNHALPNLGAVFTAQDQQNTDHRNTADRANAHVDPFVAGRAARENRQGQQQIDFYN